MEQTAEQEKVTFKSMIPAYLFIFGWLTAFTVIVTGSVRILALAVCCIGAAVADINDRTCKWKKESAASRIESKEAPNE